MRTNLSVEQRNALTATTQAVLAHQLNCFGKGDLAGTVAAYAADSRFFTPDGLLRWLRDDSPILREVVQGLREAGDVLRDAGS
jgi:hypothetical protein